MVALRGCKSGRWGGQESSEGAPPAALCGNLRGSGDGKAEVWDVRARPALQREHSHEANKHIRQGLDGLHEPLPLQFFTRLRLVLDHLSLQHPVVPAVPTPRSLRARAHDPKRAASACAQPFELDPSKPMPSARELQAVKVSSQSHWVRRSQQRKLSFDWRFLH